MATMTEESWVICCRCGGESSGEWTYRGVSLCARCKRSLVGEPSGDYRKDERYLVDCIDATIRSLEWHRVVGKRKEGA